MGVLTSDDHIIRLAFYWGKGRDRGGDDYLLDARNLDSRLEDGDGALDSGVDVVFPPVGALSRKRRGDVKDVRSAIKLALERLWAGDVGHDDSLNLVCSIFWAEEVFQLLGDGFSPNSGTDAVTGLESLIDSGRTNEARGTSDLGERVSFAVFKIEWTKQDNAQR